MEEDTSFQIIRFTKVERQFFDFSGKRNAQPLLCLFHIYQQGNFGDIVRNAPQTVADDKFLFDDLQKDVVAKAHDGGDGFVELCQRRSGEVTQSSCHLCQTNRFDDVGY